MARASYAAAPSRVRNFRSQIIVQVLICRRIIAGSLLDLCCAQGCARAHQPHKRQRYGRSLRQWLAVRTIQVVQFRRDMPGSGRRELTGTGDVSGISAYGIGSHNSALRVLVAVRASIGLPPGCWPACYRLVPISFAVSRHTTLSISAGARVAATRRGSCTGCWCPPLLEDQGLLLPDTLISN